MNVNSINKSNIPLVSVIIPAYNAIDYLAETIETVFNQTCQDFELIIVDDGSTDDTGKLINQLSQENPQIRMISQTNQGVSAARNTGIKQAQGKYIAILDADDLWEPTKLEKQVNSLENNPLAGLCYTWTALADSQGRATGRVIASLAEGNVWQQLSEMNIVCCGSTPMIRRICFDDVGFFDENLRFSEDWDMWWRIAAKYNFSLVPEPLIRYRQHPSSHSTNCQLMLETSRTLIERNFAHAPIELLHLRNRSYGCIYLYLGWRAIESQDYQLAQDYRNQAIAHRPQLAYSATCLRLTIAILMQRWLGANFYAGVRAWVVNLRRQGIRAVDR